jgi:hypothetical protein
VSAQLIPIRDYNLIHEIQKSTCKLDSKNHSSFGPYYFSDFKDIINDSLQYSPSFLAIKYQDTTKKSILRFNATPIYEAIYGQNIPLLKDNFYNTCFGGLIDFSISDKLGISYLFTLNIFNMSPDLTDRRFGRNIVGGTYLHDVAMNNDFRITYAPYKFLKLELANSKNFLGDGYRSFLLSDNARSYPYFKAEAHFLGIKYSCIWAALSPNIRNDFAGINFSQTKFAVFHYFDWSVSKRLSLGVFESIVSKKTDFFSFEYLNPVIFFRPVEFSLGSEDNALLGASFKLSINNLNAFYGQLIIDDIIVGQLINDIKHTVKPDYTGEYGWFANKWGIQLGFKSFDIFKVENLDFFTEVNIARPYLYSHFYPEQNYSNNGQSLAHPLGANFVESVSGVRYKLNNLNIDFSMMYVKLGMDQINTHYGQNIFLSTMDGNQGMPYIVQSYGNRILQGNLTDIISTRIDFTYFLKGNKNMCLNAGYIFRNTNSESGEHVCVNYLYLGIKTNLSKLQGIY